MILRIGQRTKSRLRLIAREAATATAYFGGKYVGWEQCTRVLHFSRMQDIFRCRFIGQFVPQMFCGCGIACTGIHPSLQNAVAGEMRHRVQSVWWGNTPEVSKPKNLNTNHIAVGDTVLFAGWVGLEAGVYVPFTGEVLKNVTWRKSWGKRYRWHNLAINKKKLKSKWSNRQRKKIMKVPFNDQNCWHLPSQLRGFAVVEGFPLYFRKNKRKRWTKIFITVFHIVSKNKSCNVPIAYFALVLLCCLLIYLYIHTTRKFLW